MRRPYTVETCSDRQVRQDNIVACTGVYTRTVSGRRLGKHVPAATNRRATIELLLETGCFYVVRAEML
jgi:hypothetical protein